jgi:hypothetical protein
VMCFAMRWCIIVLDALVEVVETLEQMEVMEMVMWSWMGMDMRMAAASTAMGMGLLWRREGQRRGNKAFCQSPWLFKQIHE